MAARDLPAALHLCGVVFMRHPSFVSGVKQLTLSPDKLLHSCCVAVALAQAGSDQALGVDDDVASDAGRLHARLAPQTLGQEIEVGGSNGLDGREA